MAARLVKNLNEHLLLTTIEAVVLVGRLSIQSIQPLILSMTGYAAKTVRISQLGWKQ